MPSVFTIDGPKKRRRTKAKNSKPPPRLGFCKSFRNPRTKKTMQTCYVGRSKSSPTGWRIQKLK